MRAPTVEAIVQRGMTKRKAEEAKAHLKSAAEAHLASFLAVHGAHGVEAARALRDASIAHASRADDPLTEACALAAISSRLVPKVTTAGPKAAAEALFKSGEAA